MIKVKQRFTDRETGDTYVPGELYVGTAERIEELRESGHLNKTETPEPEPEAEKPRKK